MYVLLIALKAAITPFELITPESLLTRSALPIDELKTELRILIGIPDVDFTI
jgi:hypothetical protein